MKKTDELKVQFKSYQWQIAIFIILISAILFLFIELMII